jgi:hypothetical protein
MVQANPFCGLPSEDANAHLQHFFELCDTIVIKDVAPKNIRLRLFPSPSRERRNSGSIRTRKLSTHGQNDPWRSSPNSSPWAKLMPCRGEFQVSSRTYGIHPQGVGKATRIHPCLPAPRDGELASPLELLQWVNPHVKRTR